MKIRSIIILTILFSLSFGRIKAQNKTEIKPLIQLKHFSVNVSAPLVVVFADRKEILRSADTSAYRKVNPQDIESVKVLKDSTATKKYGTMAASGAVEIYMKEGKYLLGYKRPGS